MTESLIWWSIAIYLLVAIGIAILSRQRPAKGGSESMSGYFLGNRQMNGFVSALSYSATTYSAFMMVGLAGLTYAGGVGAFDRGLSASTARAVLVTCSRLFTYEAIKARVS